MNVFDFDKTVYLHESTSGFYRYCALRRPLALLWLPVAGWYGLLRLLKLVDTGRMKEAFHGYLRVVPDAEALVSRFWDRQLGETPRWFRELQAQGGLVITASPEFIVGEACRRLGLPCLGTRIDIHSGKLTGPNCKGAEKVRRFREAYPAEPVEAFYSDSLTDSPMAALASRAYLVRGEALSPWPD